LLICWALGRKLGWRILLRSEDLDRERCSAEADQEILESLAWLGIDWDEPPTWQSREMAQYRTAIAHLETAGLLFACDRSRRELRAAAEAAGAPHGAGTTVISTAAMRPKDESRYRFMPGERNHRVLIEEGIEEIDDELLGRTCHDVAAEFGDPITWTRKDAPSYQFAVVVDDLRQGVTDVVRGDDLLASAALQARIARMLEGTPPRWWHLPLLLDPEGRRLSKRHGDETLFSMRGAGIPVERVIGLLARTCEMQENLELMSTKDFLDALDPASLQEWAKRTSSQGGDRLAPSDLAWLAESTT
jgi:glutamyl-tRNA synthetase